MQSTPPGSTPPAPAPPASAPWATAPHRAPGRSPVYDPSEPANAADHSQLSTTPSDPPAQAPRPIPPSRSVREPIRARLTGRLFSRWEHVNHTQHQRTDWHLVAQMRVTVAQERTRARQRAVLLGILVLIVAALDAVLLYLVLTAPALLRAL